MKKIAHTILFTFVLFACKEHKKIEDNLIEPEAEFLLSISTYNHAEYFFTGTLTYSLTNNILSISRNPSLLDTNIVLLTKAIDRNTTEKIKNIRIDTLEDFYYNQCVLATSGNEYFITIINDSINKDIRVHAYYEENIGVLINELNKHIPEKLQINYYSFERIEEQNCD